MCLWALFWSLPLSFIYLIWQYFLQLSQLHWWRLTSSPECAGRGSADCFSLFLERTSLNLCKGIPLKSTGLLSVILTKRASNTATAHSTWTHLQNTNKAALQKHLIWCKNGYINQVQMHTCWNAYLLLLAFCKAPPLREHKQQFCKRKRRKHLSSQVDRFPSRRWWRVLTSVIALALQRAHFQSLLTVAGSTP